eukprot:gene11741-biopygen9670
MSVKGTRNGGAHEPLIHPKDEEDEIANGGKQKRPVWGFEQRPRAAF